MVSSSTLLSLAALAGTSLVAAQNSTISLFLPGLTESLHATRVVASIVGANDAFRVYDVACPTDDAFCSLPAPLTVVQGVNSMSYSVVQSGAATALSCSFSGKHARCDGTVSGGPGEGNYLQDIGGFSYAAATVTAGQSYLTKDLVTPAPIAMVITTAATTTTTGPSTTGTATGTTARPAGQATSSAGGTEGKAMGGAAGMLAALAFAVAAL